MAFIAGGLLSGRPATDVIELAPLIAADGIGSAAIAGHAFVFALAFCADRFPLEILELFIDVGNFLAIETDLHRTTVIRSDARVIAVYNQR